MTKISRKNRKLFSIKKYFHIIKKGKEKGLIMKIMEKFSILLITLQMVISNSYSLVSAQETEPDDYPPQPVQIMPEDENYDDFDISSYSNSNNYDYYENDSSENRTNSSDSVLFADDASQFAEAVAQMSDDTETRVMVATDENISEIISNAEYSAVQYDGVYVIDFDSVYDKNLGINELSKVVGDENVVNEIEFSLDNEDDNSGYISDPAEPFIKETKDETTSGSTLWKRAEEENRPIVALIDTGCAPNYADEYVDLTGSGNLYDENGHGTLMADYINETSNDKALILSIKAFNADGTSTSSLMYAAVKYAIEAEADVINISASANDSQDSAAFKSVLMQAMSLNIGVVASVGNAHVDAYNKIPANIEGVIGVTSMLEDKTITGGYGRYADFGVISSSTSIATAMVTGYMCGPVLEEHLGVDVFELDDDGSEAENPVDDESFWVTDCASVLFVRAAIQQANMTYIAGAYTTVTGKSGGGALATYRVYGATPDWWEDGNTHKSAGGINSAGRTWFYMDNEGSGGYDTNSPEFDHIAASRPYYGNSQYSIYHSWAAGKILGNFQIDQINVSNSLYSYVGYHIEYYDTDAQLGSSHSNTEAQAKALAASSNAFFYENAYNTGSPAMTFGTPSSLKTGGTIYASFSKSAAAGGHASQNSTNFRYNNSWRRIHITLVFNLNKTPRTLRINYLRKGTTTAVATAHQSTHVEGDNYSVTSPSVSGYVLLPNNEQPDVISGKMASAVTVTGTMPDADRTLNVYYEPLYKLTINYLEEGTGNVLATKHESTRIQGATYSVNSPNVSGYRLSNAAQATISGTQPANDVTVNVYYKKLNVLINKVWNGDIDVSSVGITLERVGGGDTRTATLNAAGNWSATFQGVDFDHYTYRYYETTLNTEYYTSTCTASSPCTLGTAETISGNVIRRSGTITNKRKNQITVRKTWTNEDGDTSQRPASVVVHLINNTTKEEVHTATLNSANNWSYTWRNTTLDLKNITYALYEDVPDLYSCDYYDTNHAKVVTLASGKQSVGEVSIENEYSPTFIKHKYVRNASGVNIDKKIVTNGAVLTYVITFVNPTKSPKKFDIEDIVPEHTTFIDADNGGVNDSGTVKWSAIQVVGEGTGQVSFRVTAHALPQNLVTITNTAKVWLLRNSGVRIINDLPDPETGIPAPNTETRINWVYPMQPMFIYKRVTDAVGNDINTQYVVKGSLLYYHITVDNKTTETKTFTIKDVVPENTELAGIENGGVESGGTITWVKEITPDASVVVTFIVRATEDYSDISNFANVIVDETVEKTNTVMNQSALIVINKTIEKYRKDYGEATFLYKITGNDGIVAYRMIDVDTENLSGTTSFAVPYGTAQETTFEITELRNGRYDFESLGTGTPDTTTVSGKDGSAVFALDKRLSILNYTNKINNWGKLSHAVSADNKIEKD